MNTTDLPAESERELKTPSRRHLERVVSARFGQLMFKGCKNHPNGENSCCARIRIADTGEILTSDLVWEVLKELDAKGANDRTEV